MNAEDWLLRMKWEGATAEDHVAFDRWRAQPQNAAAYEQAERLWHSFDPVRGHARIDRMADQVLMEAAARPRWPSRPTLALAASVAMVLIAALGYASLRDWTSPGIYETRTGERSTIRLEDGSQLILNSGTRLKVRLGNARREFDLIRGEALFVVAEDFRRPFVVTAGDGVVTALGTRFQVRNESQRVTVTLLEGRVALDREHGRQHAQLSPGDQLRFAISAPALSRRTVDPDAASSWTLGRLQFHSTPLAEVLEEANRYAVAKIRLADASLAKTPVNGTFEVGDSASLVSALEVALPIEAVRRGTNEIVLRKR